MFATDKTNINTLTKRSRISSIHIVFHWIERSKATIVELSIEPIANASQESESCCLCILKLTEGVLFFVRSRKKKNNNVLIEREGERARFFLCATNSFHHSLFLFCFYFAFYLLLLPPLLSHCVLLWIIFTVHFVLCLDAHQHL